MEGKEMKMDTGLVTGSYRVHVTHFTYFLKLFSNLFKLYMNMSLKTSNNIDEIKALLDPLAS